MIGDATNSPYHALHSLAEAQAVPDGVVVLEGDYGGQIYIVALAREVHCSEEVLAQLLTDIDAAEWADEDGARVYYERHAIGAGVSGGMGGGNVETHVWVHPKLRVPRTAILGVLRGEQGRLDHSAG